MHDFLDPLITAPWQTADGELWVWDVWTHDVHAVCPQSISSRANRAWHARVAPALSTLRSHPRLNAGLMHSALEYSVSLLPDEFGEWDDPAAIQSGQSRFELSIHDSVCPMYLPQRGSFTILEFDSVRREMRVRGFPITPFTFLALAPRSVELAWPPEEAGALSTAPHDRVEYLVLEPTSYELNGAEALQQLRQSAKGHAELLLWAGT